MLQEFSEHLERLYSSTALMCQLCLAECAVLKCQECIQLLCEDCSLKHNKIKTFKDHKLCKLCPKHKEGMITHICMKCVQPSCSKCVMTEHLDHEVDIEMFEEGMKLMTQTMSQCETDIEVKIQTIRTWKVEDNEKLENVEKTISKVKDFREYYIQKTKEAEDALEILKKDKEKGQERQKEYEVKMNELKTVKQALKRSKDVNNDRSILVTFKSLKSKIDNILHETVAENLRFNPVEITIFDPKRNENVTYKLNNDKPEFYLEKPEFIKNIGCQGDQEWSRPWKISSVDDDCVLISDWNKDFITMAYSSAKPTVKIPAQYGKIRDACLFNDSLYTAYGNFITKRTFNNGTAGPEVKHNPSIKNIKSMKLLNESCVLLLSHSENRITEFNPSYNQTKIVVSILEKPVHVNIMRGEGEVLYLVTCQGTHSVNVYDEGWRLVRTFGGHGEADGQMMNPWGTTITKQGILVADYSNGRLH